MNHHTPKTLQEIVADKPFPDYQEWWQMGAEFLAFMSTAMTQAWQEIFENNGNTGTVQDYVNEYLAVVYHREANHALVHALVEDFIRQQNLETIASGEFDALSYGFFRSAFEGIAQLQPNVESERRAFTKRVGKRFYEAVHTHLGITLPSQLQTDADFQQLQYCVGTVGNFMERQGYLRDHFRFTFEVNVEYKGETIRQTEAQFLEQLHQNGVGYALYEMGYPVILPSAVYLYNTIGEAQHHSSRTIEELFDRVGYIARETDDFDPTGFPSDRVVELWEIRATT
jgi:hypothetical protein